MRKILVTSALPYANGPIHLGHMVEYIQTDIWVRFQKLSGHECIYVCGDDAHGTPIMLSAEKKGITPEESIAQIKKEHQQDFADFFIAFDNFYTTHSSENHEFVTEIYQKLCDNDDIEKHTVKQAYDAVKKMFLPDRFVKGTCPRCGAEEQYGDSCEVCGATYSPTELKNPISVVSGSTPIEKESEHYFFRLEKYGSMLQEWINSGHVQPEITHKLNEWFKAGLKQWNISRDAPYFGFKIPHSDNKYFYVWLDAPIGYMASFKKLCAERPELNFAEYWHQESKTELYHFLGKDIIYFHTLFWPAILTASDYRKPTGVFIHGFLTVNGQKMSKSRGTFIKARDYLNHLDAEYLRYYFAAKLNSHIDDLDLNFDDFLKRINSDLVGKFINIASRTAKFIPDKLSSSLSEEILYEKFVTAGENIAKLYEGREYNHAMREIMALADKANQYIAEKKPWSLDQEQEKISVCSLALNLFRILMIYLKPILPNLAAKAEEFLNIEPLRWDDIKKPLLDHQINKFKPLVQRINKETLDTLINEQKQSN